MSKRVKKSVGFDARPDAKAIARFMSKVNTDGPVTVKELGKCWEWTAHADPDGYGHIWWNGRVHWAHRIAYLIFNGPLEAEQVIHHRCHYQPCINPDHIEQTSLSENSAEGNRHRSRAEDECDVPF